MYLEIGHLYCHLNERVRRDSDLLHEILAVVMEHTVCILEIVRYSLRDCIGVVDRAYCLNIGYIYCIEKNKKIKITVKSYPKVVSVDLTKPI